MNKIEIKLEMRVNKSAEDASLQIDVLVSSQFLKPVEETILLKKKRDISESEVLTKAVEYLGQRMKNIKEKNDPAPHSTYIGKLETQEKYYSGSNYEPIGSIRLPKGKYLLNISFLLKTNNQWIYLYVNQGQQMLQNAGFYAPTSSYFMPHVIQKSHNVNSESEVVNINTYQANSYPVTLKNVVISAKRID